MNLLHEAKTREKSADTVKKPGGKAISSRQQTVPGRETPLFTLSLLSISLITIMGSAGVFPLHRRLKFR